MQSTQKPFANAKPKAELVLVWAMLLAAWIGFYALIAASSYWKWFSSHPWIEETAKTGKWLVSIYVFAAPGYFYALRTRAAVLVVGLVGFLFFLFGFLPLWIGFGLSEAHTLSAGELPALIVLYALVSGVLGSLPPLSVYAVVYCCTRQRQSDEPQRLGDDV